MNDQVADLQREVSGFKKEIKAELHGVRGEIKELVKAMRDLIRIDGDIKRTQDAVGRIGREVEDHEKRLRGHGSRISEIETTGAVNNTMAEGATRLQMAMIAGASSIFASLVVFLLTRQ